MDVSKDETIYDCIIIGAGPGGLQAAIHLARYNRKVLIINHGGGRTTHATRIENYLGQAEITGKKLIEIGLEQINRFNVNLVRGHVTRLEKEHLFSVYTKDEIYSAKYVIASSGASENIPQVKNIYKFFGTSFFTCVDCDGYHTTGKKLLIMGNSVKSTRLAFGMKQMFTDNITLLLTGEKLPADYEELLSEDKIGLIYKNPIEIIGNEVMEGVKFEDGSIVECDAVMSQYGYTLNDGYLKELGIKRDSENIKILTNNNGETSLSGLYALGPLRQGNAQAIIAAGQGAIAAIDINKGMLEI